MIVGSKARNASRSVTAWVLLLLLVTWSVIPIFYIVVSSFKPPTRIWEYPPKLLARPSLDNYWSLFQKYPEVLRHLGNSVFVTATSIVMTLALAFLAAYAFSRAKSQYLKYPAIFLIAVRMFPPIVITIPLYPIFNNLNMIDNRFTIALMLAVFAISMATWLMKSFIDEVPIELEESARIDGCTGLQTFWHVTLPLTAAGIFAVTVFVGISSWNDYLFSFIFATNRARTVPPLIAEFLDAMMGVEWGLLLALCVVHLAPMIILIIVVQKNLIKGMSSGAIKG